MNNVGEEVVCEVCRRVVGEEETIPLEVGGEALIVCERCEVLVRVGRHRKR
jgi:hypothetical protein